MAEVLFFIAGIGAVAGAIGVASLRNAFYAVLALVFHLLSLAALFLLLRAEFVAAAQVIVYAGAVMVLYVFVVAYVGGDAQPVRHPNSTAIRAFATLVAALLFIELAIAMLGSGLQAIDSEGAAVEPGFGSPAAIGELLLTRFLLSFELASFLLLIAAVGAVVLARRRGGLHGGGEEQAAPIRDTPRPLGTGTMREAVEGVASEPVTAPTHTDDPESVASAAPDTEGGR